MQIAVKIEKMLNFAVNDSRSFPICNNTKPNNVYKVRLIRNKILIVPLSAK